MIMRIATAQMEEERQIKRLGLHLGSLLKVICLQLQEDQLSLCPSLLIKLILQHTSEIYVFVVVSITNCNIPTTKTSCFVMTGSGTKSLMKPSLFQSLTVISLCRAYINLITSESDQESSENSDSDLQRAIERSLADELKYV